MSADSITNEEAEEITEAGSQCDVEEGSALNDGTLESPAETNPDEGSSEDQGLPLSPGRKEVRFDEETILIQGIKSPAGIETRNADNSRRAQRRHFPDRNNSSIFFDMEPGNEYARHETFCHMEPYKRSVHIAGNPSDLEKKNSGMEQSSGDTSRDPCDFKKKKSFWRDV